jgi:YVTN family beta-propeller protein
MIYVTGSDYVSVIDGKTNKVVDDITLGQPATDISINPQTNRIYAAGISYSSSSSDSVYVIDGKTNKVVDDIILLNKSRSYISINPQTNKIYAVGINSSSGSNSVSVIDGNTDKVVEDITLGQPAYEISINPQTNMIYVAGSNYNPSTGITSGSVSVIDGKTNKVVEDILLIHVRSSDYIDANPKTNIVYVVSAASDSITPINATTNEIQ